MAERHIVGSLPGVLGTLLLVLATTGAAITGTASLFYEGWGQPLLRERYVAPAAALLVLGLFALRRPGPGAARCCSSSRLRPARCGCAAA